MSAGIDGDHFVMTGKKGDLISHTFDGTSVAMQQQKGFALAIGLVVDFEPARKKIVAGRGIVAIVDLGRDGLAEKSHGEQQKQGSHFHMHINVQNMRYIALQ